MDALTLKRIVLGVLLPAYAVVWGIYSALTEHLSLYVRTYTYSGRIDPMSFFLRYGQRDITGTPAQVMGVGFVLLGIAIHFSTCASWYEDEPRVARAIAAIGAITAFGCLSVGAIWSHFV